MTKKLINDKSGQMSCSRWPGHRKKDECIHERVLSSLFHSIWVPDLGDAAAALIQGGFSLSATASGPVLGKNPVMALTNLQEASQPNQADSADYAARAHTTTCHNPSFPEQKPPCFLSSLPIAAAQHLLQGTQPRDRMRNTFCVYKFFHFRFFSFIFLIA